MTGRREEFGGRRARGRSRRGWTLLSFLIWVGFALPAAPLAHPAPFSYLDVHLAPGHIDGRLVVHTIDVAHDLGLASPGELTDRDVLRQRAPAIARLTEQRIRIRLDQQPAVWTLLAVRPLVEQEAVELVWRISGGGPPGHLSIDAVLFPYDPTHQTYVTVYDRETVVTQAVLTRDRTHVSIYAGSPRGRFAAFRHFLASGIQHILIGPDHILFVVGLLLLGGTVLRLLGIVTAFTVGHSLTLALAALDVVAPPSRVVEPLIALSIVFVGADNLLAGERGRDARVWIALVFGLVHGFGFAGVLRDIGLPPSALAASLVAFNLGVEIGQAAIVIAVARALNALRGRRPALARRVAVGGSVAVLMAGAFWFAERVFGY